jgi:predicted anti-sigma-YlaC factor YlaD
LKRHVLFAALLLFGVATQPGCRSVALSAAAGAVSQSGATYATDDDPELVRSAAPFGLKAMEGLLSERPKDVQLLTSVGSGFTQYAYAFVQFDADAADLAGNRQAAQAGRARAQKLFLRARDYGLRGLDARHAGLAAALRSGRDRAGALARVTREDVPLLYWTASSWALAISDGKNDMLLVAELPVPVAMMERALALDEAWGEGAIHEFFISWDATRSAAEGGGPERAKAHLDRVLALSMHKKLGPLVTYAESVLVKVQDRAAFTRVLEGVLRADPEAVPKYRLANILAQRRARLLLDHADELFL